jgi:hypothetical protein
LVLNAATSALQEAFELMKHKKPTEMWDEFIRFVFPTGPDNTRVRFRFLFPFFLSRAVVRVAHVRVMSCRA